VRRLRRRSAARSDPAAKAAREELLARIRRDAARIASHFGLARFEILPERPNVRRRYGICYADGRIAIRFQHAATGKSLKYSSLINTLCHELAHLRHFNHGPRFQDFYFRILEYARSEGIYRPGPGGSGRWVQLDLFPPAREGSIASRPERSGRLRGPR
jgi:predicted metal-dependent hydrolase